MATKASLLRSIFRKEVADVIISMWEVIWNHLTWPRARSRDAAKSNLLVWRRQWGRIMAREIREITEQKVFLVKNSSLFQGRRIMLSMRLWLEAWRLGLWRAMPISWNCSSRPCIIWAIVWATIPVSSSWKSMRLWRCITRVTWSAIVGGFAIPTTCLSLESVSARCEKKVFMTWSVMRRWSLEFPDEGMTSWMPMRRAKERQYPKVVACVLNVFCDRLLSSNELVIRLCADRSCRKAWAAVRLFIANDHEPRLFVWVVGLREYLLLMANLVRESRTSDRAGPSVALKALLWRDALTRGPWCEAEHGGGRKTGGLCWGEVVDSMEVCTEMYT